MKQHAKAVLLAKLQMLKRLAFMLLLVNTSISAESLIRPDFEGKFNVGEIKLYIECFGDGGPSIIVNTGFGGAGSDGGWDAVIQALSPKNKVCFYDRANLGKSDKYTNEYDLGKLVEHLHELLNAAQIAPPYLMVGHSYGSYPIKLYHDRYPKDVTGILLVDPSLYGMFYGNIAKWDPEKDEYGKGMLDRMNAEFAGWEDPGLNAEKIDMKVSAKLIRDSGDFGNKPFVLLWAKNAIWEGGDAPDDWHPDVWNRMKKLYSGDLDRMHKLSTKMKIVFADTPQHNIFFHEPDSVINAIDYLLNQ